MVWYEGAAASNATRRYLHANHQGSIVAVANASGAGIAINAYDEYGIPESTNVGRSQYTGPAWLPELGMYHYKDRIYSPSSEERRVGHTSVKTGRSGGLPY